MKPRYFGLLPGLGCFFVSADAAVAGGRATTEEVGQPTVAAPKAGVFDRAKAYLKDRGELVTELSETKAKITALEAQITEKDQTIATQNAELTELRSGRDALQAEVDRLEKEQTTVEKAASSKMKEEMAKLGVPASELPTNAEKSKEKKLTMSSSEFRNLTNAEKMEFSRNGGRLTE